MRSRIDRLLDGIGSDSTVLISGYPNIFYYSGFRSEDAYLLISRDEHILITDSRYFIQAREQSPDFDIYDIEKGWDKLLGQAESICIEENNMTVGFYEKLKHAAKGKSFRNAQKKINTPRREKDSYEMKTIAHAESIGDAAFMHILDFMRAGMTERDVALEIEMYMKKQGAAALSFETIVASGERGAMPHGVASDKIIKQGELVTLDFGCVYEGYCSDMTRTVVMGTANEWQKEIYGIVLNAQETAISGLYSGIGCAAADALARDVIANSGYGDKFGHSLGHSVGIEIHENPCFSPKSKDTLGEGNVLSVEPGIYIEGLGGVRIEDLIAVSDGKIVNLTRSPKNLVQI